jgi:hypothetical protein
MDSTETTAATEVTDTQANANSQAKAEKFYTEEEFNNHMAGLKASIQKKYEKQFSDLGDIDELRELKVKAEALKVEEAKKRGEFDKLMQDLAAKKDAEIQQRDAIIREYKVDTPLVNAAAKYRSIAPEQVKSLLKSNLRLGELGDVEVVDSSGQVRYTDSGVPMGVDELVKEFLDANPHFIQSTPSTSNTKSSISNSKEAVDISKLDMSNPEHRQLYAQMRKNKR